MASLPHIVLVHGAWHGAWCFSSLQSELDSRGIPSIAIDLPGHGASTAPLTDMHGDAQCVVDTLGVLRSRGIDNVVLVGHSYGGAVITQAASLDHSISHLVYIAAFTPEAGQSVISQTTLNVNETNLRDAMTTTGDGNFSIKPEFAKTVFYGCCTDAVASAAIARLSPQPIATFAQEVTGSPRDHIASTYVLCLRDNAVHPELQKTLATLCGSVITLDTDHSPFVSMVSQTAEILESIARSVS
ncbi:MAG: alpha/beta fold hydrolase [Ilumatobacteraceae bacterium]|nr:alpha/beta fold hydrolase [Ilumatobacteraceae bacterium]